MIGAQGVDDDEQDVRRPGARTAGGDRRQEHDQAERQMPYGLAHLRFAELARTHIRMVGPRIARAPPIHGSARYQSVYPKACIRARSSGLNAIVAGAALARKRAEIAS